MKRQPKKMKQKEKKMRETERILNRLMDEEGREDKGEITIGRIWTRNTDKNIERKR